MRHYGTTKAVTRNKVTWSGAVLRHVDIPVNRTWGNHYAALLSALYATQGSILELGICPWSSPLIHNVAAEFGRYLLTVESEPEVLKQFLVLQNKGHHFGFVSDLVFPVEYYLPTPTPLGTWSGTDPESQWGLVVISCSPNDFGMDDIRALRNRTSVFVIGDPDEHLFDKESRQLWDREFKYGFFFADQDLGDHETVIWSIKDGKAVDKIRTLACWTGEILGERTSGLDETYCLNNQLQE